MLFGIKFVFALLVELLRVLILICVLSVLQVFFHTDGLYSTTVCSNERCFPTLNTAVMRKLNYKYLCEPMNVECCCSIRLEKNQQLFCAILGHR